MDTLTEAELTHRLDHINQLLANLQRALSAERLALAEHNSEDLESATLEKRRSLDQLEPAAAFLLAPTTKRSIAALPPSARQKVEAHHKAVMTAARHAKDFNAVNGKIVTRSQQSLLELVQLLTGTTAEPTYGERGQFETSNAHGIHRVQA